jgi:hypothetical protein
MADEEKPSPTPREAVRRATRISNERDINRDNLSPEPREPGYSQDLRGDIANAIQPSAKSAEGAVSGHEQSGSTPFTVFDYLGLGFILEPPAVVVHAVMTGEHLDWPNGRYAIPFILLGAIFIYIGRNWETIKAKVNSRVVTTVDNLSRSHIVPFIIFLCVIIGVAILPIWIWPPNNSGSSAIANNVPTVDQIADAVVKKLPPPQPAATNADVNTALKEERDRLQAELNAALKSTPPQNNSALEQMRVERDNFGQELNILKASVPQKSKWLQIDDVRRWQIVKTLVDALANTAQHGCTVFQTVEPDGGAKSSEVWGEVQQPLFYAGYRFTQGSKTFFSPGYTIVAAAKTTPAAVCATRLKDLLDGLNVSPVSIRFDATSPSLASCPENNCIEITIGKLESP